MMVIVPDRLRGRYFGFRNSAASLTSLLCVPLMGLAVSIAGTDLNGYAMILFVGIVAGILALGCQSFQVDVNPQIVEHHSPENDAPPEPKNFMSVFQDANFLKFLLYFGFWTFSVNLSSPFFNIYLLKNLDVNISLVTLYNSLSAAANLVALIVWGKLADRIGNRPLLLLVGILVAITPLFWLSTGNYSISWWLLLPLIHIFTGSTWAAIDLCNNNIQMEIAAKQQPSTYFGVAAAVAGLTGALGTTAGGFLAEFPLTGGIGGLFALSAVMRLLALLPLVFVHEPRGSSISNVLGFLRPSKTETPEILTAELKK
jgi:Na+/melibiose symporter-like transporter